MNTSTKYKIVASLIFNTDINTLVFNEAIPNTSIDLITQTEWYGIFDETNDVKFLICRCHPMNFYSV